MPVIDCLVTNLPWEAHHRQRLEAAASQARIIYLPTGDVEALNLALAEATVAVIASRPQVAAIKKLRWLHWDAAGLDALAHPGYTDAGFAITGSAGRSGPAMAEHVIYFMLNLAYRNRAALAAQAAHRWGYQGQAETRALYRQTLGIIGLGHTGLALAGRAKAFEMRVMAYNRSHKVCPEVDILLSEEQGDSVDDLLRQSDFIAMCCALTNKTYHMLAEAQFALMKPGAFIINLGRGKTIDEAALLAALRSGKIAGAGLDTFEAEPLPPDSPLWDAPNLYVTPHFTPPLPNKLGRTLDIVIENIGHFQRGEPLINQLRPEDAFTIG